MEATNVLQTMLADNDFPTGKSLQPNHPKIVRLNELVQALAEEYNEAARVSEERQFRGRRMRSKKEILTLVLNEVVPNNGGHYKKRCKGGAGWEINKKYDDAKLRIRVNNSFSDVRRTGCKGRNKFNQISLPDPKDKMRDQLEVPPIQRQEQVGDMRALHDQRKAPQIEQQEQIGNVQEHSQLKKTPNQLERISYELESGVIKECQVEVPQPQNKEQQLTMQNSGEDKDCILPALNDQLLHGDVNVTKLPNSTMGQSTMSDTNYSSSESGTELTIEDWMRKTLSNTSVSFSTDDTFSSWLEELMSATSWSDVATTSLSSGTLVNDFMDDISRNTAPVGSPGQSIQASSAHDALHATALGANRTLSSSGMGGDSSFMELISAALGSYSWDTPMSFLSEEETVILMEIVPEAMRIRGGCCVLAGQSYMPVKEIKKLTTAASRLPSITDIAISNYARTQTIQRTHPMANTSVKNILAKMISRSKQVPAIRRSLEDLFDEFDTDFSTMGEIQEANRVFDGILKAMHECIDDSKLQVYGCMALAVLSRQNQSNQTAIVDAGGVAAILGAMNRHATSPEAQFCACNALAALSDDNQANQTTISHAGGILSVLKAMQRYTDNKEMQVCGCSMLYRVARKHKSNQKAVLDAGGIAVLVNVMERYLTSSEDVVRNCSSAFAVLCDGRRWSQQKLAQIRCNEVVATAMQLYASNEEIQSACGILLTRLSDASPTNQSAICAAGGIMIISSSMQEYPDVEEIQTNGCKALSSLFREKQLDQFEISDSGCILAVLNAMENYSSVEVIQVHGCKAVAHLSHAGPTQQTAICDAGGTAILSNTMQKYLENNEIQVYGYMAVKCLRHIDPSNQTEGADFMTTANDIQRHLDQDEIQDISWGALAVLFPKNRSDHTATAKLGTARMLRN